MFQAIFFFLHNFLQNPLQKSFQSICYFFIILQKLKVLSALSPSQQAAVLFTIYQNDTWTIRPLFDETINLAIHQTIFKIVEFQT